ncbi:MAG: hypothetical protein AAGB02_07000 [Pseudomonadota bacterium]
MGGGLIKAITSYFRGFYDDIVREDTSDAHDAEQHRDKNGVRGELRSKLGRAIAERYTVKKKLEEGGDLAALDETIERGIAAGRDDLARAAIAHKATLSARTNGLEAAITQLDREIQEYENALADYDAGRLSEERLARLTKELADLEIATPPGKHGEA